MSSSLLLQQCPACLARLTCIVFVMGGRWPYSWCLVECCRQDLFNIEYIIYYKVLKNGENLAVIIIVIPKDHWRKIKESERRDKYSNLGKGERKQWNIKGTGVIIVNGALGTVSQGWERELENLKICQRFQTIRRSVFLWSTKILRNVLVTWGCMLSLSLYWKATGWLWYEKAGRKTRPYNNQQREEDFQNCRLCCPSWPQDKTERMWKEG